MNNSVINVKINKKDEYSYPIIIGENCLCDAQKYIEEHTRANKILIVSNKKIYDLYGEKLNLKNSHLFLVPDGEEYKNFDIYNSILNKCFELKLERKDAIVAFGGGVIGDMTGFVASTYLRGIDFIQIPTTLLAQVDSSVGGKVAINNDFGKNLIGAFYQPKLVLADISTLKTLDERQFKTGLAEVVKYAFIEESCNCNEKYDFLNFLNTNTEKILNRDKETLQKVVEICCNLKASVVFQDEKETGLRKILNFGHTYAHALEKHTQYKVFTHGEAVAIGMKYIFDRTKQENPKMHDYCVFATDLIEKFGLIPDLNNSFSDEETQQAMKFDKKVEDGKIKFVVPVGKAQVDVIAL